jgi:hypothetical protein
MRLLRIIDKLDEAAMQKVCIFIAGLDVGQKLSSERVDARDCEVNKCAHKPAVGAELKKKYE